MTARPLNPDASIPEDPESMSPHARLAELAGLLAEGYVRLALRPPALEPPDMGTVDGPSPRLTRGRTEKRHA